MRNRQKQLEYQRAWYARNKQKQLAWNRDRKEKMKLWWQELKSSLHCARCPENHPAALDFHHQNQSQKDRDLGNCVGRGWSKERILDEVAKCTVLCSNCHRKLHWEEDQAPPPGLAPGISG